VDGRRIDGAAQVGARRGASLVAIGNFDGVHRGHRAVIALAVERARALGLAPLVLTFHPHPHVVFGRGNPLVLTPLERKVGCSCGSFPRARVVEPFWWSWRALGGEVVNEGGGGGARRRVVVVGHESASGEGAGDLRASPRSAPRAGSRRCGPRPPGTPRAFSSYARAQAIVAGDVVAAAGVLGRPHGMTGGGARDGRGRSLGAPTANLTDIPRCSRRRRLRGLVVQVTRTARGAVSPSGVMNLGVRPTVGAGRSVEVPCSIWSGSSAPGSGCT
jgi:riboflavin kinase/FMN adenylyltransferase